MTGTNNWGKMIIVTLLVTVSLFLYLPAALAAGDTGYIYYQVQSGDYLWLIGWKFETTADKIITLNQLQTTSIYPGQTLKIPPSTGFVRDLPKSVTYTVRQGDSLFIIGQKFRVTAGKIKEANGFSGDIIGVGQVITVPLPLQKRYVVQPGDTLYLVGKRFNAATEVLQIINKMNSSMLWIGQVLFVPDTTGFIVTQPPITQPPVTQPPVTQPPGAGTLPPVGSIDFSQPLPAVGQWGTIPPGVILCHIQEGENLSVLARRYHTTEDAIIKTNHLHDNLVQVNQPVFIPQNTSQSFVIPYPTGTQKEGFGELMDWEYASWIVDTHDIVTIKDIDTGKSFNIRRYGGSNHCDSEPLTAGDSAVMNGIYGGQWSWVTRAVLVYVDGKVLTASMAGMPHSYDTIADNNFSGHFDIYFLNSRSHNDNTISSDHQKMVLKAAGY